MRIPLFRTALSVHAVLSVTTLVLLALHTQPLRGQDSTWFRIVTQDAGFGNDTKALRFNALDLNGDRYPDIAVVRGTYRRGDMRLYLNTPADAGSAVPRRFVDATATSGVNAHPWLDTTKKVECISFGDIDNDGDPDLVNAVWMYNTNIPFAEDQSEVLLNDGNAVFTHVADDGFETLADPSASTWPLSVSGVSFLDYDLDGVLDAYVAAYWRTPNGPYHPDRLMKGNGDGTFTDVSQSARVTAAYPMQGASVTDWNNDGWPDVLTSPYCRSNGSLLRNEGDGSFRDIAPMAGYNARLLQGDNGQNLCQWGAYPYDFDNDGDMDVLQVMVHGGLDAGEGRTVLSINQGAAENYKLAQDLSRLHRSNPQSSHLGNMDAQWLDMNNDMLVDLVVTECEYLDNTDRPFFYLQGQDNHFYDITPQLELVGKIRSVHSVEALDYDRDGDYDLVMNSNHLSVQGNTDRGDIVLMENRIGNSNNWIGVQLVAPPDVNRAAIGARVVVYAGGVRQMREVQAGRGHFSGQEPLELLFGLGQHTTVDSIVVHWPRQPFAHSTLTDVPANQYIDIDGSVLAARDLPASTSLTLDLYPNPVRGTLRLLTTAGPDASVSLWNPLGQRVYAGSASSQWIDMTSMRPGVYLLRLQSAGETITRKVCVVR